MRDSLISLLGIVTNMANSRIDIRKNINEFLCKRTYNERNASFDYCFNYFHSFYEKDITSKLASEDNIEKSCLRLGFYLASWGMYRGSSFLLENSIKIYDPLIRVIAEPKSKVYWKIDVDNYTPENIEYLLDCKKIIVNALDKNKKPSDTLVTKIMLGIFGNTPAFDTNFKKGMEKYGYTANNFNKESLENIHKFYLAHKRDFYRKIPTIDFLTKKDTNIIYTKAKMVDMAAFQEGLKKKTDLNRLEYLE